MAITASGRSPLRQRLLRTNSGSLAMFAAILRASSSKYTQASARSVTTKQFGVLIAVGLAVAARRLRLCRRIRASVSPFLFRKTFVARLYSFRSVGL